MDPRRVLLGTLIVLWLHLFEALKSQQLIVLKRYLDRRRRRTYNSLPGMISWPFTPPKTRSQWMKVRSKHWWETVVLTEFTDREWQANFRMTRRSFVKLSTLMGRYMAPEPETVRAPVPVNMRIAIVLYKLGSCAEYRVVANQFGVHKSTVKKFVYLFCKTMVDGPIRELIRVPTDQEAIEIARRFESVHHVPQIMGLIDGSHIPVLPPSDGYKDFVNRKGWPSYVLQAVVDDKCCFWSISCKMPGSAHDARVLQQSDLYQRDHLLPRCERKIEGVDIPLLIVGDPAYPLLDWLMKGYPNSPRITPEEESLSVYLSSARVGVEMTFGMLKARWRVLLKRSDFHFTFTPKMIATCCALHNFCQKENDSNRNWLEEAADLTADYPQPNYPPPNQPENNQGHGSRAREALKKYMATHFPLRKGQQR